MKLKNDLYQLRQKCNDGEKFDYIIFSSHKSNKSGKVSRNCLSNFYSSFFTLEGETFCCNEQYFMFKKAQAFGDNLTAEKILKATDPATIKKLGREVKNYNEKTWNEIRVDVMYNGALAKFSQNEKLKEYLIGTGSAILAEGSPWDKIWGIGRRYSLDPNEWQGLNTLGFVLMEVRDALRSSPDSKNK